MTTQPIISKLFTTDATDKLFQLIETGIIVLYNENVQCLDNNVYEAYYIPKPMGYKLITGTQITHNWSSVLLGHSITINSIYDIKFVLRGTQPQ